MDKKKKIKLENNILNFILMLLEGFFIAGSVLILNEYFIRLNLDGAMSFVNVIKIVIMALIVRLLIKYITEK